MPSNETLDFKISSMEKQNKDEHKEIKEILTELNWKFDRLSKIFVTRLEFKAVSAAISIVAVALWMIWFFIWK